MQIAAQKRASPANAELVFSKEPLAENEAETPKDNEVYAKLGELQVQVDFLKILGNEYH